MNSAASQYLAFALISIIVFTVYMAAVAMMRRNTVRDRLGRMVPDADIGYNENQRSASSQACENICRALGVDIEHARRDLYLPLMRAGISIDNVAVFLCAKHLIQPIFLVIAAINLYLLTQAQPGLLNALFYLIPAIIFGYLGLRGAGLYLENATQKRTKKLQRSFPDMLDLLLVCVEAGLALDAAISRVCREIRRPHPEIAEELERTRVELAVISDRTQALRNLAERTNSVAFRSLVSSLVQAEKFGTSMSDTLRVLSDDYRTKRMLIAENKAARVPVLITVPLILCIMPVFMGVILGPAIIGVTNQGGVFGDKK